MKVRLTGLLLGILIIAAVVVPAFAAAVEKSKGTETKTDESGVVKGLIYSVFDSDSDEDTSEEDSEVPEKAVPSDSPYFLDGEQMTDLAYSTISGTRYVTVESFVLAMGCTTLDVEQTSRKIIVTATKQTILFSKDGQDVFPYVVEESLTLSATKGYTYIVANGRYLYVKNQVRLIDGKVAVPVEVLAKVFNLTVEYNRQAGFVLLSRTSAMDWFLEDGSTYYDEDTLYWLSRIIYSESGNQSMLGKIAVGNVVMNRVASSKFPNTIKGVLFQKNQFSPAMSGSIYRKPNSQSVIAAKLVMDGAVALKGVLFFNGAGMNTSAARNRTYVATIGGHDFYAW